MTSFVEKTLAKGVDLLLEIETQGAFQVKEKVKDAVSIFVLPPSVEVLEERLRGRQTEDEEAIQVRLNFVRNEIEASAVLIIKLLMIILMMRWQIFKKSLITKGINNACR